MKHQTFLLTSGGDT